MDSEPLSILIKLAYLKIGLIKEKKEKNGTNTPEKAFNLLVSYFSRQFLS